MRGGFTLKIEKLESETLAGEMEIREEDVEQEILHSTTSEERIRKMKVVEPNINRALNLNKKELSGYSNRVLSKYCIGLYKDNSLTHKIRFNQK
jgi:hypothetical protein